MIIEFWLIIGCVGIIALSRLWIWGCRLVEILGYAVAAARQNQIAQYQNELRGQRWRQAFQDRQEEYKAWRSLHPDVRGPWNPTTRWPSWDELLPGD